MLKEIMALENNELNWDEVVSLFSVLIKEGTAWTLQGSYGRNAISLINAGFLDVEGNIL